MYIHKITIKNFRSIVNETIKLGNLSTFVGLNDAGKSNILKALNLFFNQEISPTEKFDFSRDYSLYAQTRRKKAKTIQITLELQAPGSFAYRESIYWTKEWRADSEGPSKNDKRYGKDKSETIPSKKSRVSYWLDNLTYKYIPAVKSDDYLSTLMGDLYDVLDRTASKDLEDASRAFSGKIQKYTEQISKEILSALGLNSKIQLPANLSNLFRVLEFEVDNKISLHQRGDGIKARHIPILLEFIAKQENSIKKRVKRSFIWGYEEPENNLEMQYAYEQAAKFSEYVETDIQMLLTTHSPAFYSIGDSTRYFVKMDTENNEKMTKIVRLNPNNIDVDMGLMPVIEPHITDSIKEIEKLKQEGRKSLLDKPTILVEGKFDEKIIKHLLRIMGKDYEVKECGGVDGVYKKCLGWHYIKYKNRATGIVDNDKAGAEKNDKFYKQIGNRQKCSLIKLEPTKEIIENDFYQTYKGRLNMPVFLESFFVRYWKHAKDKGWLESLELGTSHDTFFFSYEDTIERILERIPNITCGQEMLIKYKLKKENKADFAQYVCENISRKEDIPEKLVSFLENKIISFLANNQ